MTEMSMSIRIRLSLMMFLQFMLFAVFWSQLAAYLDKIGVEGLFKSLILSSMAIGCLASPVIGMIADRFFASQKVLAAVNLLGAVFLAGAGLQKDPVIVFACLLAFMLCYMPTWGLTSAIAMAHSPSEKFPQIRVFGSIGWWASGAFSLVAIKALGMSGFDGTATPLFCGAAVSLLGAVLALTLPNTPPPAKGQPMSVLDALGLRSLVLMKDRNFAVFILISFLAMIPFTIYWSYCSVFLNDKGFSFITITMNWGQFAEMFLMLLVTVALTRIGMKWAMCIGLVALVLRYVAFYLGGAFGIEALYFVGILVHGAIFGFFFVGGQIYIARKAPKEIQAQAQGFIFLVTFGLGLLVGNFANGALIDHYTTTTNAVKAYDWNSIWAITTGLTVALLVLFLLLFKDDTASPAKENAQ
jgi:nucleoside transporter